MSFHKTVSWVKSVMRIIGYIVLLFSIPHGVWVLVFSELVGMVEEIKEV